MELKFRKLDVLDLWSKFKSVYVAASIDGHKELGELVREGLVWDRFVENVRTIRKRCPNVEVAYSITVSVLNVLALPELCEHLYAIDPDYQPYINFNVLQEPRRYSIQILPPELKAEAKRRIERFADKFETRPGQNSPSMRDEIQPVINFMMHKDRPGKLREFRARTLHLDEMRNRDTAAAIPELAPLLHETAAQKYARTAKQAVGTVVNKLR